MKNITPRNITVRQPELKDSESFIAAVCTSKNIHSPWVSPPDTPDKFSEWLQRCSQPDHRSWLICDKNVIHGVINLSNIVRGCFQSGYLGWFAMHPHEGTGSMTTGIGLVLSDIFLSLGLHRVEANIQPGNIRSIQFVIRNGFKREGFSPRYLKINDEWKDHERWALTIEDWIPQK